VDRGFIVGLIVGLAAGAAFSFVLWPVVRPVPEAPGYERNVLLLFLVDTTIALAAGSLLGYSLARRRVLRPAGPLFPFPQAPLEVQIAAKRMGAVLRGGAAAGGE